VKNIFTEGGSIISVRIMIFIQPSISHKRDSEVTSEYGLDLLDGREGLLSFLWLLLRCAAALVKSLPLKMIRIGPLKRWFNITRSHCNVKKTPDQILITFYPVMMSHIKF